MPATPTKRTSRLRAAAATTALAIALTGCGPWSDDDGQSSSADDHGESAEEPDTTEPDENEDSEEDVETPDSEDEDVADDGAGNAEQGWDGTNQPPFLEAHEIPSTSSDAWTAAGTAAGPPSEERFCTEDLLPANGVWHQQYQTEFSGVAHHVVIDTGDSTEATDLMDQITSAVTNCPNTHDDNKGTTEFDDHGEVHAGDAASAFAMTYTPDAPAGISFNAIGVARSGSTVTYVLSSEGSDVAEYPAGTFDEPLSTALTRING